MGAGGEGNGVDGWRRRPAGFRWRTGTATLLALALLGFPAECSGQNITIQLGGVFPTNCASIYPNMARNVINLINKQNSGQGFGIKAGFEDDRIFFQLNFTHVEYPVGEYEAVGKPAAELLFPTLDYVIGMGDKCPGGDPETLLFAEIADRHKKMYITTRGPSKILSSPPTKSHFMSIHLNSDEYATTALSNFHLRGVKTVSVIYERSGNLFFEGVGDRAVEVVAELGMSLVVHERVDVGKTPDAEQINRTIGWAIGNRTEALVVAIRNPGWAQVTELLKAAQAEHSFKAVWSTNLPFGPSPCNGVGAMCEHVIGASQISADEINVYRDGLLQMTYAELKAHPDFAPIPNMETELWDQASSITVFVQALQNYYRFRPFDPDSFLGDPIVYEKFRSYIREGALIGNTFAGPTRFTPAGANGGRSPSTMQGDETGAARLVISDLANKAFVFPAPGSVDCALNMFRNYSQAGCFLCAHHCDQCASGSQWVTPEVCGCSPTFFHENGTLGEACDSCPLGGVCDGGETPPYPKTGYWANTTNPTHFYECLTSRCLGGKEHLCGTGFGYRMCEGTANHYYNLGSSLRVECSGDTSLAIFVHVFWIAFVLATFFFINQFLVSRYESIALFLDSLQRIAIVSNFRLRWPIALGPMFSMLEVVLLDADLARPDCVYNWNFADSYLVQKGLLFAFLLFFYGPVLFRAIRTSRQHQISLSEVLNEEKYEGTAFNQAICSTLSIISMMYPTLTKNILDAFVCRNIDGGYFLVADPNFQCYTPSHMGMIAASSFLVPLLVVGFPATCTYVLWNKEKHRQMHHKKVLARWGTLYARYEPPWLGWECWRIFQVMVLVMIQTLLWEQPLIQANLALLLFLFGLSSQFYAQPYQSDVLDRLDSLAYIFSVVFTLSGMNFFSTDFPFNDVQVWCVAAMLLAYTIFAITQAYLEVSEVRASHIASTKLVKLAASLLDTYRKGHPSTDDGGPIFASTSNLQPPTEPGEVADMEVHDLADEIRSILGGADLPLGPAHAGHQVVAGGGVGHQEVSAGGSARGVAWVAGTGDDAVVVTSTEHGFVRVEHGKERRKSSLSASDARAMPPTLISREASEAPWNTDEMALNELPATFNGFYLRNWVESCEVNLKDWNELVKLESWMAHSVSDESVTGQFSLLAEANLFRGIDKSIPWLLCWISQASDQEIGNFASSMASISEFTRKHGSESSAGSNPDIDLYKQSIVDNDRSSVIYWLLLDADKEQREHFFRVLNKMLDPIREKQRKIRKGMREYAEKKKERLNLRCSSRITPSTSKDESQIDQEAGGGSIIQGQ